MEKAIDLTRCLPLLCAILGDEYGVNIVIGNYSNASVAMELQTGHKTVMLPALASEISENSNAKTRFFIDHECAHIRKTDFTALAGLNPIEHAFENIIEDWRVENSFSHDYPGSRDHFDWGIKNHLFPKKPKMPKTPSPHDITNWTLLYVRSWDIPELTAWSDEMAGCLETLYPGLMPQLRKVLDETRLNARSTQDSVFYARRIVNLVDYYVKQEAVKNMKSEKTNEQGGAKDNAGNGDNGQANSPGDETGNAPTPPTGQVAPERATKDALKGLRDMLNANEDQLPKGIGEQIRAELEKQAANNRSKAINICLAEDKIYPPMSSSDMSAAKGATAVLRSQLQGLLQSEAAFRRSQTTRGRMNYRQLHSAAYNTRIFEKKSNAPAVNTAVHLLLDISVSMRRDIPLVSQIGYALADTLYDTKGINMGVTAFPGDGRTARFTVNPILRHGEKMHSGFALEVTGGTPMGEALWWVMQQMFCLAEPRRLVILVTDGEPDNKDNTIEAIRIGSMFGFEYYGIGIRAQSIKTLLPSSSMVISNINELGPALFSILRKTLTSEAAA